MNKDEFTALVKDECEKNKVEFVIDKKIMADDIEVNGYFCSKEMALKVSTHNDNWFATLVHEYCHMLQYFGGYKPFIKASEVEDKFWAVLEGEVPSASDKNVVQLVEYDCEKRVLKLAKQLDLPIDLKHYAKRANAYVYFYDVMVRTGEWYEVGKEPYNNENILKLMPDELDKDYKKVSEDILIMMEKELFGDLKELRNKNKELEKVAEELDGAAMKEYSRGYDHGGDSGYERAIKDLQLHLVQHGIDWNNPGYGEESIAAGLLKYLIENHDEYKRIFDKRDTDRIMDPNFKESKINLWYRGLSARHINGDTKDI